jgi:beta-N-acetylhexosaminidase
MRMVTAVALAFGLVAACSPRVFVAPSTALNHTTESIATRIDGVMMQAIEDSVFPGGVVHILYDGSTVFHKGYGFTDYSSHIQVDTSTIYDLASITKVLSTSLAVMGLHRDGLIQLYHPVWYYLPEFNTDEKRQITIYQFLTHTSGLPAFRTYVDQFQTRDKLYEAMLNEPLVYPPGQQYLYSDIGLILTGLIIERVTNQRLDDFLENTWYRNLGLVNTTFNPKNRIEFNIDRVAPTEIDTIYRYKRIHAEVHDERSWYMDGVAGHAGLFSNSSDVGRFTTLLLNKGQLDGINYLDPELVRNSIRRQAPLGRRGIGFDLKTISGFSSAGSRASNSTYGHTGFTGTSFWIDPERKLAVIILTNRTYPYRGTSTEIARVRAQIGDLAQEFSKP